MLRSVVIVVGTLVKILLVALLDAAVFWLGALIVVAFIAWTAGAHDPRGTAMGIAAVVGCIVYAATVLRNLFRLAVAIHLDLQERRTQRALAELDGE